MSRKNKSVYVCVCICVHVRLCDCCICLHVGRRQEGGEREEREKERKERWVSRINKNPTLRMWGKKQKHTHIHCYVDYLFDNKHHTNRPWVPAFPPLVELGFEARGRSK